MNGSEGEEEGERWRGAARLSENGSEGKGKGEGGGGGAGTQGVEFSCKFSNLRLSEDLVSGNHYSL